MASSLRHRAQRPAEFDILAGTLLISFSAIFVRLANVGPTASGVYRTAFGALALLAFVAMRRDSLWTGWKQARWAVLAGACFASDIYFWHRAIHYVGPGLATILGNFQVFFVGAVGILFFRERVGLRFLMAVPLAVTGLFMLVGLRWGEFDATYRRGVIFGACTALSYALYLLALRGGRNQRNRLSAAANLAWATVTTGTILTVIALLQRESLHIPNGRSLLVLVSYGFLCQALGWIVISRRLQEVDASRASLILLMQPALTFVWDMLFFHRPTTTFELAGAGLALIAIYLGGLAPRSPARKVAI